MVEIAGGRKSLFAKFKQKCCGKLGKVWHSNKQRTPPLNIKKTCFIYDEGNFKILDKRVLRGDRCRGEGGGVRTSSQRNKSACYEMLHKASDLDGCFNTTDATENGNDTTWNIKILCRGRSVKKTVA